jgi:hypothetical protein
MNKYEKWYASITETAKNRKLTKYTETHHIVPRSLGGTDESINLVKLTAREHFVCHWLLTKIYTGESRSKMIYALNGMKRNNDHQERYETPITSRVYAKLKEEFGKIHSQTMKGKIAHNKGKKMSEEQKAKIRATKKLNPYTSTDEDRKKQSLAQTGLKRSIETKNRISNSLKGKLKGPMSDEEKLKRSIANKGKPKNPKSIAKRTETLKTLAAEGKHHSQIILTCPHCRVSMKKMPYARWHGDKCKSIT